MPDHRLPPRTAALALLLVSLLACGGSAVFGGGRVEVKDGVLLVDRQPLLMASVEIPYYRFRSAADWKIALRAVKEAGMNTVSFYIPWGMHETAQGQFDFDGRTLDIRNLNGFLTACEELGLYTVARVGPYECGEMTAGGIPGWVVAGRPHMLCLDYTDSPVFASSAPMPSLLHPEYLKLVGEWYRGLYEQVLSGHLHTRNRRGSIIMVSIENELVYSGVRDAWNYDYNPVVVGSNGLYQKWLAARYGDVATYNRTHEPKINAWTDVKPPRVFPHENPDMNSKEKALALFDWQEFHDHFVTQVVSTYAGMVRKLGVDVPLNHNFNMPSPDMPERMNAGLAEAHNFALSRRAGVEVTPTFWGPCSLWYWPLQRFRSIQARYAWSGVDWGFNPETPWGSNWGGYDSPIGCMTQVLWEMAHGARGFNIYMGVDSLTHRGDAVPGIRYQFWDNPWTPYPGCAPLDHNMNRTLLYNTLCQLGSVARAYGPELAQTRARPEVALALYPPYDWQIGMDPSDRLEFWSKRIGVREDARMHKNLELVAGALIRSNAEYDVVNVRDDRRELGQYPALVAFLYDYMDHATQERLAEYVRDGGTLIAFGYPPYLDERLQPDETLKKAIFPRDVAEEISNVAEGTTFRLEGFGDVATSPDLSKGDFYSGNKIYVFGAGAGEEVATYDSKPCGYMVKVGKGAAVLIGSHHVFSTPKLWKGKRFTSERGDAIGERNFGVIEHLLGRAGSRARLARSRTSVRPVNVHGMTPDRCEVWSHADPSGVWRATYVLNRAVDATEIAVETDGDTLQLGLCGVGSALVLQEKGKLRAAILNGDYDVRMVKDNNGTFWGDPVSVAPYVRTATESIGADTATNVSVWFDRKAGTWQALATIGCHVNVNGKAIAAPGFMPGAIAVDGHPHDWAGVQPLARDPEGDAEFKEVDLTKLYVRQEREFLCIGFNAPLGGWAGTYGIGLLTDDTAAPRFTGGAGQLDAWKRNVVFTDSAAVTYEIYLVNNGKADTITVADFCRWNGKEWEKTPAQKAGITLGCNRPMEFVELRVPLKLIGDPKEVSLLLWVTGGGTSPPYDAVPFQIRQLSTPEGTDWGGAAVFDRMACLSLFDHR